MIQENMMRATLLPMAIYAQKIAAFTLLLFCAGLAVAQNSIESVNVSPQPGGKVVIRVGLKEALKTAPAGDRKSTRLNSSHT